MCHLLFEECLVIDFQLEEPGFSLTATVGPAPQQNREAVFALLLEANLAGRGVGRCCLALDADCDEIVLSRYYERDEIEVETLEDELDHFITVLQVWMQRLISEEMIPGNGPILNREEDAFDQPRCIHA